jgi:hypothetical protein
MIQILIWILMAYGLCNIVVYGSIFSGPRTLIRNLSENEQSILHGFWSFIKEMTSCMMCFGFHTGWFLSIFIFSPIHNFFGVTNYVSWFFDALLSSGSVWAINSIIEWFEVNRPKTENNE